MTRVVSIIERLGLGGGGKVKAVFHRQNALAELAGFEPVLFNLHHGVQQRLNFAQLQGEGAIARDVRHVTLPDALFDAAEGVRLEDHTDFPDHDRIEDRGDVRIFVKGKRRVMVDRDEPTPIGRLTRRTFPGMQGKWHAHLLEGELHQMTRRRGDGSVEITDFARGRPVRWMRRKGRTFVIGRNLITGQVHRQERGLTKSLVELARWEDSVVFFDGVPSAYLAPVTGRARALFLHADHRAPGGKIVPRSQFLIENFKGEAIVTSTRVHERRLTADLVPAARLHVVPHFCEIDTAPEGPRRHLVTVSRLELSGKPIHECIEAFARIAPERPEIDYLIYGTGAGEETLRRQIARAGLKDRVRLMGYTNDVAAVFRGAVAALYPTMTEGFGLSILESLASGCPVISYDVDYGPREMIDSGANGELVPPGDIDAIEAAIRRVLEQPAAYQAKAREGLGRYSRAAYLEGYRALVETLRKRAEHLAALTSKRAEPTEQA